MNKSLNEWGKAFWDNAELHGFHEEGANNNIPTQIANIHGEVSEAFEEYRKPGFDPKEIRFHCKEHGVSGCKYDDCWRFPENHKPEGFSMELSDILIRVMECAHHYGIDIEKCVSLKHEYNLKRPFRHGKVC